MFYRNRLFHLEQKHHRHREGRLPLNTKRLQTGADSERVAICLFELEENREKMVFQQWSGLWASNHKLESCRYVVKGTGSGLMEKRNPNVLMIVPVLVESQLKHGGFLITLSSFDR